MIPQHMIDAYCRKSRDTEGDICTLFEVTVNDHGFLTWRVDGDILLLINIYGDGKYWNSWIDAKAVELGCTKIIFGTKRNNKLFERKYGYTTIAYLLMKEV